MSDLFDRYFMVLAGRLAAADCGAIASHSNAVGGGLSLGWPLDLPELPTPQIDPAQNVTHSSNAHE
jgi:hypothetical protein